MVKVSIVMPVYNGAEFLQKSIESVSKQTLNDLELICVDDGSTDNSIDVLNELKKEYDFIKIVQQKNQGAGPARNNGIRNANGEYIAFLDADDEFFDDDALERMYDANTENAKMICGNMVMIENDDTIADNFFYTMNDYKCFTEDVLVKPEDYGVPLSFYKNIFEREFLIDNDIFFPPLRRGQDPPFLAKILTLIDKIQGVAVNLYGHHYRVGGGAEMKIDSYEKQRGYLQHFKDTCDILAEGGLKDLSDVYKIHIFRYLARPEVIHDVRVYEMFDELFGIDNDTFDVKDFNYCSFIIPAKMYLLNKFDTEEYFIKVNKLFLQLNPYGAFNIDEKIIDDYFLVIYSYSFEDFKSNYAKYLSNNLKFKKEFMEFKIKKFIFNQTYYGNPVYDKNTKRVVSNSEVWRSDSLPKHMLKKIYGFITDESI